jgi:hypothetical protein
LLELCGSYVFISDGSRRKGERVNLHAIIRSGIGDDLVTGHLVGAAEVRAAQEETSHALSRGNIVGGEEVCGADDEGVVGSDVGRGVVVVCSRALCGCGRGTHGGGVFVGDGSRGVVVLDGGGERNRRILNEHHGYDQVLSKRASTSEGK